MGQTTESNLGGEPAQLRKARPHSASKCVSRREFIALSGGSAATAVLITACGDESASPASAMGRFGGGDVGILNYALTLEYLERAFCAAVDEGNFLTGRGLEVARELGQEEDEHIATLTETVKRLGGVPAREPTTRFPLQNEAGALELGAKLENLVAAAYLGQMQAVEDAGALEAMLSIHSVEGRHAAAVGSLRGQPVTPDGAFARPASANEVLRSVGGFIADAGESEREEDD